MILLSSYEEILGVVNWNGEADAGDVFQPQGVDADDLPVKVDQRSSGVTECDAGICLNKLWNCRAP